MATRSKACVRFRRGKWVVDYRDAMRRRRWLPYPGTEEGEKRAIAERDRLNGEGADDEELDRNITVEKYIEVWLAMVKARVLEQTWQSYTTQLRHLAPLYPVKVRELTRRMVARLFTTLAGSGTLARTTVALVLSITRNMLQEAVEEDHLLPANPALGVRRKLGLRHHALAPVKAMEGAQLERFLGAAQEGPPEGRLVLAIFAFAGLRLGEVLGLQVADVSLEVPRRLSIERQVLHRSGKVGLPKGGKPRLVDISDDLAGLLTAGLALRRRELLRTGVRSEWLLYPDLEGAARKTGRERIRALVERVLRKARLPAHFTPHCLRHTYATLLLQRGEELLYVSRQLGHAQVSITADRYGKWLVMPAHRGGPNLLSAKKPVADLLSKA